MRQKTNTKESERVRWREIGLIGHERGAWEEMVEENLT
jgi:hypothetical protein